METFFEKLAEINNVINDFVWVKIGLVLLIGAGIIMTCCTKFFQVSHIAHWWKTTIGSVFKKDSNATKKTDKKTISQFLWTGWVPLENYQKAPMGARWF